MKKMLLMIAVLLIGTSLSAQNPWNGKVIIQGFWWNYWNDNYPNSWANYLTELSPRLRDLGIDMVWIPPTVKNDGTHSSGYSPFDHYDLGDKYQKGSTVTRVGNKNELLRMVAVMKANGLGIVSDIVLNHVDKAGSVDGSGGLDPAAWVVNNSTQYKNFRYVSYSTPANSETAIGYTIRNGRWPKNWQNFHPNPEHNEASGDWTGQFWGPDICYYDDAHGFASNTFYNPDQATYSPYNNGGVGIGNGYMRKHAREWLIWYKKQTGVDGFRFDAIKHFPEFAMEDFLYNVQHNAGFASGGDQMFAVGEFVGSEGELDNWANAVQNRAGTFDFSLRQELKNMTSGNGFYNLSNLVDAQQNNRLRTVPFVNNHDTFRPELLVNGDYDYPAWTYTELGGGKIDPNDPRLAAAYAAAFAVDGSPQVFFEDLFDIGTNGNRYDHDPKNPAELPYRDDIANIIWAHQKLNFKQGAYLVRHQAADALIIERNQRAIIGINDSWSSWQNVQIQTSFGPNVQLHDYSGANAGDIWTDNSGQVTIWIPPCDGSNVNARGYTIWGPTNPDGTPIDGGFNPAPVSVSQEWELANDLGDSHANSLMQGGALPSGSTAWRTAGSIYAQSGQNINIFFTPTNISLPLKKHVVSVYNSIGTVVHTFNGSLALNSNYVPAQTGWYTIRARHYSAAGTPLEKVKVKVTYRAPAVVNTAAAGNPLLLTSAAENAEIQADETQNPDSYFLVSNYPNPFNPSTTIKFSIPFDSKVKLVVTNLLGQEVKTLVDRELHKGSHEAVFNAGGLPSGVYIYQLHTSAGTKSGRMILTK